MNKILVGDSIVDRDNRVDIEDRGYQFGDGVYEVIGVYKGKLWMLDEHLERLERSASEIQLSLPFSLHLLQQKIQELVELNQLDEGVVYLQVTRGIAERFHPFPNPEVSPVLIAYTKVEHCLTNEENHGATAVLTEDIRWLRCHIKTLNLLPNVLAKQQAIEANAVEAILHRGEMITEASASNVFIVKNKEVYTHPATQYILNGITRKKVLEICKASNINVHEELFTIDELLAADEVFITATKLDVVPIIKVDQQTIGKGMPGDTTSHILKEYRNEIQTAINNPFQS